MKLLLHTHALILITYGYMEKLQVGMAKDEKIECAYQNDFVPIHILHDDSAHAYTHICPEHRHYTAKCFNDDDFFSGVKEEEENGCFSTYMSTASLNWVLRLRFLSFLCFISLTIYILL